MEVRADTPMLVFSAIHVVSVFAHPYKMQGKMCQRRGNTRERCLTKSFRIFFTYILKVYILDYRIFLSLHNSRDDPLSKDQDASYGTFESVP